jgi:YVTN family beta-propeller protein
VTFLPDNTKAYVAHAQGIAVINVGGGEVFMKTIASFAAPTGVVAHPSNPGIVFASAGESNGTIIRINTATDTISALIPVGKSPAGIAMDATGSQVYVANEESDTVSVISVASNAVTNTLVNLARPYGIGVTPSGSHIWVINECPQARCVHPQNRGFVKAFSTSTLAFAGKVNLGAEPYGFGKMFK